MATLKIDTDAHWFPPEWVELIAREVAANGAAAETVTSDR